MWLMPISRQRAAQAEDSELSYSTTRERQSQGKQGPMWDLLITAHQLSCRLSRKHTT